MKKMSLFTLITSLMLVSGMNALSAQDENSLEGYSVGLNIGNPIITGKYFDGDGTRTGPTVGVVIGTPYSFDFGSYSVGVGFGIELANMGADDNYNYTGFYLSLSSTVYEIETGPISFNGGLGIYGGLAVTGTLTYDYSVPDQPIVIQPYARTALLLDADGNGNSSYLMSIGAMINYNF